VQFTNSNDVEQSLIRRSPHQEHRAQAKEFVSQKSVVGSAKKSSMKEVVIASIVLGIIVLGTLTFFRRAATVAITGPRKITVTELATIPESDLDQPDAVQIKVDLLEEAQSSTPFFGRSSTQKFYWATAGTVTFVVQSNNELQQGVAVTVAGRLTTGPTVSGGSNGEVVLPHTVVVSDNPTTQFRLYTLLILAIFVGAAAWLKHAISIVRDPSKSKAVQTLNSKGPTAVQEIDAVLTSQVPSTKVGDLIVGHDWIIRPTSPVQAIRKNDAAWIFGKQVKKRVNGVPTGSNYFVVLNDRFGDTFEVPVKKNAQEAMVVALAQVCPRAFIGHSDELAKLWPKERAQAITMIDEHLRNQSRASVFASSALA
jgi:hypothetical protein